MEIKTIDDVRALFQERQRTTKMDAQDIKDISMFLEYDDAFFNIPMETAMGILIFLGEDKDKVLDEYKALISPENYLKMQYITISNRK